MTIEWFFTASYSGYWFSTPFFFLCLAHHLWKIFFGTFFLNDTRFWPAVILAGEWVRYMSHSPSIRWRRGRREREKRNLDVYIYDRTLFFTTRCLSHSLWSLKYTLDKSNIWFHFPWAECGRTMRNGSVRTWWQSSGFSFEISQPMLSKESLWPPEKLCYQ